jgi:hypothetical protein
MPEPFVSADEAAQFLCVKRRHLLALARRGMAGAYALGAGGKRKVWVFRLSNSLHPSFGMSFRFQRTCPTISKGYGRTA